MEDAIPIKSFRLFSKHIRDLLVIAALALMATFILVIMSFYPQTHDSAIDITTAIIAAMLAGIVKIYGMSNSRMGVVDMFINEITGICSSIYAVDMVQNFIKIFYNPNADVVPEEIGGKAIFPYMKIIAVNLDLLGNMKYLI